MGLWDIKDLPACRTVPSTPWGKQRSRHQLSIALDCARAERERESRSIRGNHTSCKGHECKNGITTTAAQALQLERRKSQRRRIVAWVKNWKGLARKWSWPIFSISEGFGIAKTFVHAEIRVQNPQDINIERYRYTELLCECYSRSW
jgi:hypothetical protein